MVAFPGLLAWLVGGCITIGSPDGCGSAADGGSGGEGGAGGDGGSGGEEPTGCDTEPTCDSCFSCAAKSVCAASVTACQNDSSCVAIDECVTFCGGDPDCEEECGLQNLPGVDAYNAAMGCLYCQGCPNRCSDFAVCN